VTGRIDDEHGIAGAPRPARISATAAPGSHETLWPIPLLAPARHPAWHAFQRIRAAENALRALPAAIRRPLGQPPPGIAVARGSTVRVPVSLWQSVSPKIQLR
jgi:hypothetical protein